MTNNNEQEIGRIEPPADQKQTVKNVNTNGAEAANEAPELKGEELEERIAPASFGEFTFTKRISTSSP